jgi:hypothetical protein
MALISLEDARDALASGSRDAALRAMKEAHQTLERVGHTAGVPLAQAARHLGISVPTVRSWAAHGVLRSVPGASPAQIEPESLRIVGHALAELRERGRDREWLGALLDHLEDRAARQRAAVKEGLDQLAHGELEAA